MPANPHRVPHSGRNFTATTESRYPGIIESQSCIRLLPAPLSLAAHTRRAVSGFVESSLPRQWLTTMRIATKTLQGPASANDSRGAFYRSLPLYNQLHLETPEGIGFCGVRMRSYHRIYHQRATAFRTIGGGCPSYPRRATGRSGSTPGPRRCGRKKL